MHAGLANVILFFCYTEVASKEKTDTFVETFAHDMAESSQIIYESHACSNNLEMLELKIDDWSQDEFSSFCSASFSYIWHISEQMISSKLLGNRYVDYWSPLSL